MIIEHLHDDPRALRACSLVCKDWAPTTRRHLFRKLHASGMDELETLPSLLSSAPDIHASIQCL
ncbi:hypothetical protein C8T65DRAFT_585236, partial [Cerioporus squamosus]